MGSRVALAVAMLWVLGGSARADRPPDCVAGGDPAATGFAIPLKGSTTLAPIKNGVASFEVTSTADKPDADRVKLSCAPGAQLARDVQPIEDGKTYADNVGVKALNQANGLRVRPGSVKGSFLARKILGMGIKDGTASMPSGCPDLPPASGCLTPQEIVTILSWIQRSAPND